MINMKASTNVVFNTKIYQSFGCIAHILHDIVDSFQFMGAIFLLITKILQVHGDDISCINLYQRKET